MQNTPANTMQKYENGGRNKKAIATVICALSLLLLNTRFFAAQSLAQNDKKIKRLSTPWH